MNSKLSSLGWLVLLLPFFCVSLAHAALSATFADEVRDVSGFHAIANSGNIVVEVRLGNRESLRLEGDDAAIRQIETVVQGGTLKIRFKRQAQQTNWGKVTAYVSAKQLDELQQSGSGSISVLDPIVGKELQVSLSGSGKIAFETDMDVCNASISGSGRITANGRAAQFNASISGSGRFDGGDLKTQAANLKVSGSGNMGIHVDRKLDASISGSGNITYSGDARTNARTSGSGKVRKR
ncbi:MAG TPA: head GIN domain-containing protein [Parapedobacter sp.]|nr:head GIN domain-containing protein [Parapedobacter sp.]